MDSFFGRKRVKSDRPVARQPATSPNDLGANSVPYDKLAPPGRPPVPISAPITNPTLTANGTEFNVFNAQKARADRRTRDGPASPDGSPRTADSVTLYSDTASSSSASTLPGAASRQSAAAARRARQSGASTASGRTDRRSPSGPDFAALPASASANYPPTPTTRRPASGMTTRSDRTSRYAPSFASSQDSPSHHLSHAFDLRGMGGFHFPRPENDEEIEAMFEEIKETRDVSGSNMTLDQKWTMVHNAAQLKWDEERKRATQRRIGGEPNGGGPQAAGEGTPHWYIMKFLDKTITAKQAQGLTVSLRSREIGCVKPCNADAGMVLRSTRQLVQ